MTIARGTKQTLTLGFVVGLGGLIGIGQAPSHDGFYAWSATDLQKMADALKPQMDEYHFKSQTLATEGTHRFLVTHREGVGQSEWHEGLSDVMFVQTGHAKLIYGGTMVDAKVTGEGEQRGVGIEGGKERDLKPGDVVVIPPQMPHQINATPEQPINYFVVKVAK